MKLNNLFTSLSALVLVSSCAQNSLLVKREVSSEPAKYISSTEAVQKKMKEIKAPPMNEGFCFADPESKMYLTNIKASSTGNFKELRAHIDVDKLENTSSTEYYFCRVTCLLDNRYASFWTTLTDSPNRHSDDNAFICQGVTMEMVNIPGTTLSSLGPIVHSLNMFNMKEILPKIKETNYKMSQAAKSNFDSLMNESFKQIAKAYIGSSLPAMIEAGIVLDQIAYQKPGYKQAIDKYVLMYKAKNGVLKNEVSKDYFVLMNLIQFGGHLIYEKM